MRDLPIIAWFVGQLWINYLFFCLFLEDLTSLRSIAAILGGVSFGIFVFLLLCSVIYKKYTSTEDHNRDTSCVEQDIQDDYVDAVQASAPPSYQRGKNLSIYYSPFHVFWQSFISIEVCRDCIPALLSSCKKQLTGFFVCLLFFLKVKHIS